MKDDFFHDEYYEDYGDGYGESASWTELDWRGYLKKADDEIAKFAATYSINRQRGLTLDDIAKLAGWAIPENFDKDEEEDGGPSFAYEPWTLFNHPIFIVVKGLIRCMREHLKRVIANTPDISGAQAWELASRISKIETNLLEAVNSTDLSEDTLARCNYKTAAFDLNEIMALLASLADPKTDENRERMARVNNIVMDLRQLSLDLSARSRVKKNNI